MVKIKGPEGGARPVIDPPIADPAAKAPKASTVTDPKTMSLAAKEELQREWQRLRDLPHKQILRGAASLFGGVFFPANLLDTNSPENDPKYMRLLSAVLGLDDLDDYFYTESSDSETSSETPDDAESDEDGDSPKSSGRAVKRSKRDGDK